MAKHNEAQMIEASKILLDAIQNKASSEKLGFESVKQLAEAYALVVQHTPAQPATAYIG